MQLQRSDDDKQNATELQKPMLQCSRLQTSIP